VKAKKAAAIEERRLARRKRDEDRAAGLIEPGTPIEEAEDPLGLPADEPDSDLSGSEP
jgi:hypothetical protein